MSGKTSDTPSEPTAGERLQGEARDFLDLLTGGGDAGGDVQLRDDAADVGPDLKAEYEARYEKIGKDAETLSRMWESADEAEGVDEAGDLLQEIKAHAVQKQWSEALRKLGQFEPMLKKVLEVAESGAVDLDAGEDEPPPQQG